MKFSQKDKLEKAITCDSQKSVIQGNDVKVFEILEWIGGGGH